MQQRFLLQILLLAQHVSGTTMPIIRSSRVLYSGCCLWYLVPKHVEQAIRSAIETSVASSWRFISTYHHQEFRNCVCNQVSYSIILDSVFCLSRAVSVQGLVGPGLVCDGCVLGGVRCELWHHSLFTLC